MRILFLTDSLSLPRADGDKFIGFEETYINLLRKEFPNFVIADSAIGGATILDLYKQAFYYKEFKPDLVFVHCGIVDCAPRAWKSLGRKIIRKTGVNLARLTKFMRKYRGLRYTNPSKFDQLCEQLNNEFGDIPVYAIGILPGSDEYEQLVPGIRKSIELYNSILANHFDFITNHDFPNSGILNDHHHLTSKGHKILADKLKAIILELA